MGNVSSAPATAKTDDLRLDASTHSIKSCASWATTDHTNSGPWGFLVKEHVQCLCEGGRSCTREDPARQGGGNAVPGLHSNWVGGQVLAMARPWQENVVKHDLVSKFQELEIGMILNLQEVGEHDSCGPGNLPSCGFTYSPEPFMAARIGFYNLSWRDMGVPTLDKMMDIVQVMHFTTAVEKKRIAVHCHAGLGRTGLAIACFMVATGQATAAQAIERVRQDRPGALQTAAQVLFVSIFEQYLQHLRCLFKVADLKHLSLGNEGFILTKVCRRISRSLSTHGQGTADPLAAATAALNTISITGPAGPGAAAAGPASPLSGSGGVKAAAWLDSGRQGRPAPGGLEGVAESRSLDDWAAVDYSALTMAPCEAAAVPSAAEAAANAALNLGPGSGASGGMVMHARRLSGGGGSMKLVCNLRAIREEKDKPVHVIETDSAVTEVYGHGLTIIRSAHSTKKLSSRKSCEAAPSRRSLEERVMDRLPTEADLGLDRPLPWNEKFAIRPEAFSAEAWLPEAPGCYLEALRRQQRLLHGLERRQSLRLHRLLKAAAKALTRAAQAYNEVPVHQDASAAPAAAAAAADAATVAPPSPLKRYHSRSRSMAAAADLLALNVGSGSLSSGAAAAAGPGLAGGGSSSSLPGTPNSKAAAAGGAGALGLMLPGPSSNGGPAGGTAGQAVAAGGAAGSVLPGGIHLGAPGTSPVHSGLSTRNSSSGGAGPAACAASSGSGCGAAAAAALLGLPSGLGGSQGCLSGCCAPSFAAGLLAALLFKGRFPEEYESCWSACPRVQGLGLGEGHVFCEALQRVKLGLNGGDFGPLEAAPAAVAAVVLADWFESFVSEALCEATLGLLVEEAEELLGQAASSQQQQQGIYHSGPAAAGGGGGSGEGSRAHGEQQQQHDVGHAKARKQVPQLALPKPHAAAGVRFAGDVDDGGLGELQDEGLGRRKAAARSVVCALAAHEQDLFLCLAAVLRHARLASLDDSRLPAGATPGRRSSGGGCAGAGGGDGGCGASAEALQQQAEVVAAEVEAVMRALYRIVASWLLGPLAVACSAALDATSAFLQFLATDDVGFTALLQASREQGMKKSHSQPALLRSGSGGGPLDPVPGLLPGGSASPGRGSGAGSPRSQLRAAILRTSGMDAGSAAGTAAAVQGTKKSKLGHAAFSSPALADMATKAPRADDFFLPADGSSEPARLPAAAAKPAGSSSSSSKSLVGKIAEKLHVAKPTPKSQSGGLSDSQSASKSRSASTAAGKGAAKGASPAAGASTAGLAKGRQSQQQPGGSAAGGHLLPGDALVPSSHDSSSQLLLQGQRGLCVGVQRGKSNATHMEAELAVLSSGRQAHEQQQQQPAQQSAHEQCAIMAPLHQGSGDWAGALYSQDGRQTNPSLATCDSPAAAQSSNIPAAAAAAPAEPPGPCSPGRPDRQQPLPLPPPGCPVLPSSVSPRLPSRGSRPSSNASSPPGSTMDATPVRAAAAGPAPAAECSGVSCVSTFSTMAGLDVTASQLLSVSAMSDIQLPSFASTASVAESLMVAQSRQSWDLNTGGVNGVGPAAVPGGGGNGGASSRLAAGQQQQPKGGRVKGLE